MFPRGISGTASGDTGLTTITGYSIRETSNVLGAKVTFSNATGDGLPLSAGTTLWGVQLAPGETINVQFGENPVTNNSMAPATFYLNIDSGTVQYAVFGQ